MTDDERLPDAVPVVPRLPPESAIIVRARDPAVLEAHARALVGPCRRHGVTLLVSGDAGLARAVGADGVHLPEAALRADPRRPEGSDDWLVTASAHSGEALRLARDAGMDAATLSPVFATESHPGAAVLGLARFAELAAAAGLPVYAMGGVTEEDWVQLQAAGAVGMAGIGFLAKAAPGLA